LNIEIFPDEYAALSGMNFNADEQSW